MSSRELSLVLMDGASFIAELSNYPTIPPFGHVFTFKRGGREYPYRVIETQSIIDLDNAELKKPSSQLSNEESVRVDVELVH